MRLIPVVVLLLPFALGGCVRSSSPPPPASDTTITAPPGATPAATERQSPALSRRRSYR